MTSANVTSQCFQAKFGKERAAANKVTKYVTGVLFFITFLSKNLFGTPVPLISN